MKCEQYNISQINAFDVLLWRQHGFQPFSLMVHVHIVTRTLFAQTTRFLYALGVGSFVYPLPQQHFLHDYRFAASHRPVVNPLQVQNPHPYFCYLLLIQPTWFYFWQFHRPLSFL